MTEHMQPISRLILESNNKYYTHGSCELDYVVSTWKSSAYLSHLLQEYELHIRYFKKYSKGNADYMHTTTVSWCIYLFAKATFHIAL